jgi:catechol 2,3-dioxygenase-like lactoylglutathione lyase family enzyme
MRMRWILLIAASSATMFAQLAAPNAAGISYGHVHMFVNEPDAEKKIWVDLLGARPTSTGTLQLMSIPGAMVIASKGQKPPTGGSEGSTVPFVSFRVKSYAGTKTKLASANVKILKDTPGRRTLLAEFPEGVRFEFVEDGSLATPLAFNYVEIASVNPLSLRDWYVKMFSGTKGRRGKLLTAVFPGGEIMFEKAATAGAPTKGRALDHIGFEITGLEAFCKKLEAAGTPFDLTYRVPPQLGGLQISYIIDPEGTRIELTEGLL